MSFARRAVLDTGVLVSAAIRPDSVPALAEAASAELTVSSDSHLTDLHPWRGIPILPPAAFLVGIR